MKEKQASSFYKMRKPFKQILEQERRWNGGMKIILQSMQFSVFGFILGYLLVATFVCLFAGKLENKI